MEARTRNLIIVLIIAVAAGYFFFSSSGGVEKEWRDFKANESRLVSSIQTFLDESQLQEVGITCSKLGEHKKNALELEKLPSQLSSILSKASNNQTIKAEAEKRVKQLDELVIQLKTSIAELDKICKT